MGQRMWLARAPYTIQLWHDYLLLSPSKPLGLVPTIFYKMEIKYSFIKKVSDDEVLLGN